MHSAVRISTADGQTQAAIVPTLGFTCIEFQTRITDQIVSVLDSESEFLSGQCRPGRSGIPLLFPFPNRIRDGRYTYRGHDYVVPPPAWFPQTIHGFCVNRPWRVSRQSADSLTGEFILSRDAPERRLQWPADAKLMVTYTVLPNTLRAEITVENLSESPLPWGFGTHPYFRLPLGAGTPAQCRITAAASKQWVLDHCFPTGSIQPVATEKDLRSGWNYGTCPLDDVYTDLPTSAIGLSQRIDDPVNQRAVVQRHSDDFRELVVFTPKDRNVICLEPYTCATDAINLQSPTCDAGLRELGPRASHSLWFEITVEKTA